ncbi:MAG: AraC family transcriptional regulator [Clostridia bacterium]|nr:AraC family transcriptional regulator [Clostridia bacterium]
MFYEQNHPTITVNIVNSLVNKNHLHNEYELIYCFDGSFDAIIDSKSYTINKGQFSISFPNQGHYYCYDRSQPIKVCILIFNSQVLPEINKILDTSIPLHPIYTPSNFEYIEELIQKMYENRRHDDFSILKRSGYLKLLAGEIFMNMELIPNRKTDPKILSSIMDYCNNNFASNIHLKDLEEHLHINKYYISHIFREKVKMGFNEYVHSLRIKAAQKLLIETDETITTIAYNVGFNTVRSFNRSFLKISGMTPGEYRATKTKKSSS